MVQMFWFGRSLFRNGNPLFSCPNPDISKGEQILFWSRGIILSVRYYFSRFAKNPQDKSNITGQRQWGQRPIWPWITWERSKWHHGQHDKCQHDILVNMCRVHKTKSTKWTCKRSTWRRTSRWTSSPSGDDSRAWCGWGEQRSGAPSSYRRETKVADPLDFVQSAPFGVLKAKLVTLLVCRVLLRKPPLKKSKVPLKYQVSLFILILIIIKFLGSSQIPGLTIHPHPH